MACSHCRCQHPFYGIKITVRKLFTVVEFLNNTTHRVGHISFWCVVFFVPFFSLRSLYLPIYASNPAHPLELSWTDLCSTATYPLLWIEMGHLFISKSSISRACICLCVSHFICAPWIVTLLFPLCFLYRLYKPLSLSVSISTHLFSDTVSHLAVRFN